VAVNLIAIALVIAAIAVLPVYIGPDLPPLYLWIVRIYDVVFVAGWLWMMARPPPPAAAGRMAWPLSSRFVMWGGIGLQMGGFWLWMPYADEAVVLACIVTVVCTVTLYVMTSLEPPPSSGRIPLAPMVEPVALAVYLVVYPIRMSAPLVLFLLCYAFVIVVLQRFIQHTVDDAHAARQAAERALVQVAAERDAKTRFLASASHDLGQPLQAARLSFDQAMRSPEGDLRRRAVRRVTWAFDATEQLLRRMLDHLRLESGAVEANVRPVAVGPLIARIAEMHEPAARLAGVEVVAMPTRLAAAADPELLERVLGNLVVNSLRHAKAGRVVIGARRRADRVRLWVIDDGVGIAPADTAGLFQDYVQGSNHGDEIRGGFGLGLASAKRMMELMGGRIALEGNWLNGSAFWVELPVVDAKGR
jgi:signal transduction histidine kinase